MTDNNPYASPQSMMEKNRNSEGVYREKNYVILDPEGSLPGRCFHCNQPTSTYKTKKLSYLNPWWYLLILLNILILIVTALIVSKRFQVDIPICPTHEQTYKRRVIATWCIFLIGITMLVSLPLSPPQIDSILIIVGCLFLLFAIIMSFTTRMVYIGKMRDNKLWLSGCKPAFLDSLPTSYG